MVYLKEVLPNPAGRDTAAEWIKLFNDGEEAVSLTGWSIRDGSGKKFIFGREEILPHQEVRLPYSATRITLNNDGDTLILSDPGGQLVDELNYVGPVAEDEIIISSKSTPSLSLNELTSSTSLQELAFAGEVIRVEEVSPLLIAFSLALVFGVAVGLLTKKLTKEN